MKVKVIQISIPVTMEEELQEMRKKVGITNFKDLFNIALTILDWVIGEREQGNRFCSVNKITGEMKESPLEKIFNKAEVDFEKDQFWPEIIESTSLDEE